MYSDVNNKFKTSTTLYRVIRIHLVENIIILGSSVWVLIGGHLWLVSGKLSVIYLHNAYIIEKKTTKKKTILSTMVKNNHPL